jgi:hypothetical protein
MTTKPRKTVDDNRARDRLANLRAARVAKSALDLPPSDRALLAAEQYLDAILPETIGTAARTALAQVADTRR